MQPQPIRRVRSRGVTRLGITSLALLVVALLASSCEPGDNQYTAHSTAYCLQGQMADGNWVHDGAVAMNTYPGTNRWVPFGEHFRIETGPLAGKVVTVEDRYGYGTQFDIWMQSCWAANDYGRRDIVITDIGR